MSRNFGSDTQGGFQVDSPVKKPVARKLARSAPPYTEFAREEPWEGGDWTDPSPPAVPPKRLDLSSFTASNLNRHSPSDLPPDVKIA